MRKSFARSAPSSSLRVAETAAIAPELLLYVDEYIDETDLGSAIGSDLDATSNLLVFSRELFGQLFANVVGEPITGFGPASAQRANILRRRNRGRWPGSLRRLVGHFQHLCKIYSDLLGETYGGGSQAKGDFHFEFIPTVLADLESWAIDTGTAELA